MASLCVSGIAVADTIHLNAEARYQTCMVNQSCQLSGFHDIEIINNNDQDHAYNYTYSLCSDNNECHNIGNIITVKAHTKWNNHYDNFLMATFNWKGNHQLWSKTTVGGAQYAEYQGGNFIMVG